MSFKMLRAVVSLVGAIALATLLGGNASGQVADGNLVGAVLDSTGAAVQNARVEAENVATGVKATTTTDSSGVYHFNNLLVGTYKITSSAAGLAQSGRDVVVELSKTTTANITLA